MTTGPDQTPEEASDVQEDTIAAKSVAAPKAVRKTAAKATVTKKAPVRRKKPTARSQRPRKVVEPVVKPPLTLEEIREQAADAKKQIVASVVEPAAIALGSWSETVRDTISGALSGLLGSKKRGQ
jgi:adenosylmethionine-8-amino-7-oxononanoate aminotransferase